MTEEKEKDWSWRTLVVGLDDFSSECFPVIQIISFHTGKLAHCASVRLVSKSVWVRSDGVWICINTKYVGKNV